MKKFTLGVTFLALFAISHQADAQTTVKKEIKKEITIEEKNGEKVLTIKSIENNQTKIEIYKGANAEAKIKELSQHKGGTTKTMVVNDDGSQSLQVEKKVIKKTSLIEKEK